MHMHFLMILKHNIIVKLVKREAQLDWRVCIIIKMVSRSIATQRAFLKLGF